MPERYRIARQRHLGEMLDRLQADGVVRWRFDYDHAQSRAIYWVAEGDGEQKRYDTRSAERLVQKLCDDRQIVWKAVPPPGGERQFAETQAWIAVQQKET
ncbi:hypothetical protein [Amycolatopsis sp. NBC_01286]|uniref:hypothetical protein n=1 Tax=Amycolatopsis sp. NBC_01286 TaxID=2903560 RepID=UPI002E15F756|nr:hypothetical protein OG570_14435 [Amycolatopsis sp. NBC_01286]